MLRELKILRTRAHPYIEQAAMTGHNMVPTTAAGVVGTIKHVWYLVVIVAVHSAFDIFRQHFRWKCPRWRV